jgi:ribosomal protein S18 acetylase RimI-like enzyme
MMATMTAELERATAFERALLERSARKVPFLWGTALFHDDFPRVWDLNLLEVEGDAADADAESLAAEAERLHAEAGHEHRKIALGNEGERLAPGFRKLGWSLERHLVMAHRRAADGAADTRAVSEVDWELLAPARERSIRSEPWGREDEVVRQLLEAERRLDEVTAVRRFAVLADGRVASYCYLFSDGRTAQIETVGTLEEHRNHGYARAIVSRALEEARGGHELVFLVADADDWPKELYAKLGFDAVGTQVRVQKTPGPSR